MYFTTCNTGTDSHGEISKDLQIIIDDFESELKSDLLKDGLDGSISAAIVSRNEIIWSKALGFADVEK